MSILYIHHRVRDFASWKPVYDSSEKARKDAGLREKHLLRDSKNPNDIMLLFDAADDAKAEAFVSSPELKKTMEKAGVIGQPDVHLLNVAN